jgi:hypothetical protein
VAYRVELPLDLSNVHNVFHVSNLKKCMHEEDVVIPLEEIRLDDKLRFVEQPIEIIQRDVQKLKRCRIPIVKVRRDSRRRAEFTWELEDQFKLMYPHLFPGQFSIMNLSSSN